MLDAKRKLHDKPTNRPPVKWQKHTEDAPATSAKPTAKRDDAVTASLLSSTTNTPAAHTPGTEGTDAPPRTASGMPQRGRPTTMRRAEMRRETSFDLRRTYVPPSYVSLEISGSELEDLSFVDLPGLIMGVGRAGNERDIDLVKLLVTSYIQKESCVILLTVACETNFENQGAHHLAKMFNPEGKQMVSVLTKPDHIPIGDEPSWLKIIRNETEPLVNNWYHTVFKQASPGISSA
ncbi:hypothetical protein BU15DRAFT_83597 [Melanogaster broomeanus]|nr:hypothetical protein BU15DRAFT_83597 [Melanogaster broomeanus]